MVGFLHIFNYAMFLKDMVGFFIMYINVLLISKLVYSVEGDIYFYTICIFMAFV